MFPLPPFVNRPRRLAFDVWVSDPGLASELASFLTATGYEAKEVAGDTLSIRSPATFGDDLARAELVIWLRLWRRRHPSETAEIVE